ncbi:unnamed protein product [Prunus armeniaca]
MRMSSIEYTGYGFQTHHEGAPLVTLKQLGYFDNASRVSGTLELCGARNAARIEVVSPRLARIAAQIEVLSLRPTRIAAQIEVVSPRPARIATQIEVLSLRPARIVARIEVVSP